MDEEKKISIMEQYYIDPSKIDSNDRRQIKWLNMLNEEHPDDD